MPNPGCCSTVSTRVSKNVLFKISCSNWAMEKPNMLSWPFFHSGICCKRTGCSLTPEKYNEKKLEKNREIVGCFIRPTDDYSEPETEIDFC